MESSPTLSKGDWVHAAWFEPTEACLSGSQLKTEAKLRHVHGTITHIRGNHPTEPTSVRIWVKPDDGSDEVIVHPEWIKAHKPV
jgi:hypothetical protein